MCLNCFVTSIKREEVDWRFSQSESLNTFWLARCCILRIFLGCWSRRHHSSSGFHKTTNAHVNLSTKSTVSNFFQLSLKNSVCLMGWYVQILNCQSLYSCKIFVRNPEEAFESTGKTSCNDKIFWPKNYKILIIKNLLEISVVNKPSDLGSVVLLLFVNRFSNLIMCKCVYYTFLIFEKIINW